jgi:hypothetical protein
LTGRLPFEESTPQATILAVIGTEAPRPRVLNPSIPDYAELVIHRAMAKHASERYADMPALLHALEPLVEDRRVLHEVGEPTSSRPSASDAQAERFTAARPKLVVFLLLALALLLASFAIAVAGIEQVAGWSLNRLELGLLLTCAAAVAITPTLLVVRRIRSLVWGNTNRVVGLLSGVHGAVLTAVATYGLAWLSFRFFDGIVLRLMGEPIRANITWPGWDFLLPVVGLGAGAVALLRERALTEMLRGRMRGLVVALASLATLALAAFVILLGLRWQTHQPGDTHAPHANVSLQPSSRDPTPVPSAVATSDSTPTEPSVAASAGESASAHPVVPSPAPSASNAAIKGASESELSAAGGKGVDGWVPLASRYPNDPRVLRGLVLAHASRAAELAQAMLVMRRLFKVAPEEAKTNDMQYLVQRAAETPGLPAELAWKMMSDEMGTYGPDLLYALILNKPRLADHAERLLNDTAVRRRGTSALAIAYELRSAPNCAARLPLLERATQLGDDRALAVLGALSTGTARGCGKDKKKPCPPACPDQVDVFRAAMTKLSLRVKGN